MSIVPALLLAAEALAAPTPADSITVELITGFSSSGWEIEADGKGRIFDLNRKTGEADPARQQSFAATIDDFALARKSLAKYRNLAKDGSGCPIAPSDVFGFRLVWAEGGVSHTATFTDSCGGIPTDLDEALRPIAQRIDRYSAAPPADVGSAEDK